MYVCSCTSAESLETVTLFASPPPTQTFPQLQFWTKGLSFCFPHKKAFVCRCAWFTAKTNICRHVNSLHVANSFSKCVCVCVFLCVDPHTRACVRCGGDLRVVLCCPWPRLMWGKHAAGSISPEWQEAISHPPSTCRCPTFNMSSIVDKETLPATAFAIT